MSKVCFACNNINLNLNYNVNANNIYLDQLKSTKNSKTLSDLVKGDKEALKYYKEDQKGLLDEERPKSSKLLQVCHCPKKLYHPECLISRVLITLNYTCPDCNTPFSLTFKQDNYGEGFGWFIFKVIVLVIILAALFVISILLFTEDIKLTTREKTIHNNHLLGILILIISILLFVLLLSIIKNRFIRNKNNLYKLRDLSGSLTIKKETKSLKEAKFITKLKENLKSVENQEEDKSEKEVVVDKNNDLEDIFILPEDSDKKFFKECLIFSKNRLKMDEMELAQLKNSNMKFLYYCIKNEKKLLNSINEGNVELEEIKNKNKKEEIDVMLNDDEQPKLKRSHSLDIKEIPLEDRKKFLPKEFINLVENVYVEKMDKIYNEANMLTNIRSDYGIFINPQITKWVEECREEISFDNLRKKSVIIKFKPDYNKMCVKQEIKKKLGKNSQIISIYNYDINFIKPKGLVVKVKEDKPAEKINLIGGWRKKKLKEKEKHNDKKEEKKEDKLNTSHLTHMTKLDPNNKAKILDKSNTRRPSALDPFTPKAIKTNNQFNVSKIDLVQTERVKDEKETTPKHSAIEINSNAEINVVNSVSNMSVSNHGTELINSLRAGKDEENAGLLN